VSELVEEIDDFESVMRANGPKIYTLAVSPHRKSGGRPGFGARGVREAYEHWEKFRGESDVGTWLYRICVNCWKNRVRYERRRSFWKHFSLDARRDEDDRPPGAGRA